VVASGVAQYGTIGKTTISESLRPSLSLFDSAYYFRTFYAKHQHHSPTATHRSSFRKPSSTPTAIQPPLMQRQTSWAAIDALGSYFDGPKIPSSQESIMMDDWHSEWATAPCDPLPSNLNHLYLLNEPANIDMKDHALRAEKVSLIHYDINLVPEGRAQQELRWAEEAAERRLKQDVEDFVCEMERAERREQVVKAAKRAEVVDLTEDETTSKNVHRTLPPLNIATRQQGHPRTESNALPFDSEYYSYDLPILPKPCARPAKAPWRASIPNAPQRPRTFRQRTAFEEPTDFAVRSIFPRLPVQGAPYNRPQPSATNMSIECQATHPPQLTGWSSNFNFTSAGYYY